MLRPAIYLVIQTNMEQSQTAAKQAYLREHISPERYEDFGEFCEAIAGNTDIDGWTIEYVRELVDRFAKQEAEPKQPNKHSFHLYQTGNANDIKQLAQEVRDSKEVKEVKEAKEVKESKEEKTKEVKEGRGSGKKEGALQVLDSIFERHQANSNEFETRKYDKSFFESCNFWGVPPESDNTPVSPNKFATGSLPLPSQNFQQLFQTGLNIRPDPVKQSPKPTVQPKPQPSVQTSPRFSKPQQPIFVQIPAEQQTPVHVGPNGKSKVVPKQQSKKAEKAPIKLVSVKAIKVSKIDYEGEIVIKEPLSGTVACFRSCERHALSHPELRVTLQNHEIVNRSFFSSDYVMYHVKVLPAGFTCKRNLQDFQKLRKQLQSVYPGLRMPYLQRIGWLGSQLGADTIARNKKYLQFFLSDLIAHPELRNSRILQDFLTLRDHKQVKRKFEEYAKLKKISALEELCLLQGQVHVELTEEKRQYSQALAKLVERVNAQWLVQERLMGELDSLHLQLAEGYKRMAEMAEETEREVKDFNRRVRSHQIDELQSALASVASFCKQGQVANSNDSLFLQDQLLPFYRYERENMAQLTPLLELQKSLLRSWLRVGERGEQGEYLSERLKEYKVEVLGESKHPVVLRYQCGYASWALAEEGQRYFEGLGRKLSSLVGTVSFAKLQQAGTALNAYTALVHS